MYVERLVELSLLLYDDPVLRYVAVPDGLCTVEPLKVLSELEVVPTADDGLR